MKRFFKLLVSLAVYSADSFRAVMRSALGKTAPGTCVVLYYHEVVESDRARFGEQLDVIGRAATPVSALELTSFAAGKKHVAITVDDAFVSFFNNGLPEIERRKIPVLVFIPTGWIGRSVDWAMEEVMASQTEKVAPLAELKIHARHPLVRFGSHTVNHRKLSSLPEAEALMELADSKKFIERELGCLIETISFPYGGFTARDVKLAAQLGYNLFFTTTPERVGENSNPGVVGRFRIDPSDWMIEVKLKASGAYRWQSRVQQWRARFRSHPVATAANVATVFPA